MCPGQRSRTENFPQWVGEGYVRIAEVLPREFVDAMDWAGYAGDMINYSGVCACVVVVVVRGGWVVAG